MLFILIQSLIQIKDLCGHPTYSAPLAPGLSISTSLVAASTTSTTMAMFEQFVEDNYLNITLFSN